MPCSVKNMKCGGSIHQNTFSFIPPNKLKMGRIEDFEDQQSAFFAEIDGLQNQFGLKETDQVSEYHRAWCNVVNNIQFA